MDSITLKGLVMSKHGSVSAFAREVNWSVRKARDIMIGHQKITLADAEVIADAVGAKNAQEFAALFFPGKFTM